LAMSKAKKMDSSMAMKMEIHWVLTMVTKKVNSKAVHLEKMMVIHLVNHLEIPKAMR